MAVAFCEEPDPMFEMIQIHHYHFNPRAAEAQGLLQIYLPDLFREIHRPVAIFYNKMATEVVDII
jgi:hypothetical protein